MAHRPDRLQHRGKRRGHHTGSSPSLTIGLAIPGNAYTVINDVNALQSMGAGLAGKYALGSNIDATATSTWNAGAGFTPVGDDIAQFTGVFDGLGHTITGLTINRPTTNYVGLFGYTNGAAMTIRNVGMAGGSVTGYGFVGGLVGGNSGAIINSYWDTQTSGTSTGIGGGTLTGATGLTTVQMKQQASFTGWDFTTIWRIYDGYTYPLLKSFLTPLTVTANAASKIYDGLAYSGGNGVFYSIASPTLSGTLGYSGTSQGAINAGNYTITPGGYYSTQQGYDIAYVDGTLTITPASLTLLDITANDAGKTYGTTLIFAGTEFTPVGLLGSDTIGSVTLSSTGAVATANVGAYAITPSAAVFSVGSAGNYTITYVDGVLTVTPAALTVTANADGKTYDGLAYTGGNGVGYSGFVNSETSSVLGGALVYSGTSQGAINAGSYTIIPSGLTSGNYTITFVNGALTITAAATPAPTPTPTPTSTSAAPIAPALDYTNIIQEGLGSFGGNDVNEPAPQTAKYEEVYASADSAVFAYTAGGLRPLITDEQPKKSKRRLCLIQKN